jgi:hypothetical protein
MDSHDVVFYMTSLDYVLVILCLLYGKHKNIRKRFWYHRDKIVWNEFFLARWAESTRESVIVRYWVAVVVHDLVKMENEFPLHPVAKFSCIGLIGIWL